MHLLAGLVCLAALASSGCEREHDSARQGSAQPVVLAPGHVAGERTLMGTRFAIQVVMDDEDEAQASIAAALDEVARVESEISSWQADSQLSAVNRAAGAQPVPIGSDLLRVLVRAKELYASTDGAFDVTFAACGGVWDYDAETIPEPAAIADCLTRVGSQRLELDHQRSTARLAGPGMRVGLGAIGKGYGIDKAAEVLAQRGIRDYIVEGGGDIRISGSKHGTPWTVGVAHPRRRGELLATMHLDQGAVVTSGDYERGFEKAGMRYHHILDPRTGWPARGSVGVTIVAPTAMDADALATGVFVLGLDAGLALIEGLDGVEALIIGEDAQHELAIHTTSGFPRYELVTALNAEPGAGH